MCKLNSDHISSFRLIITDINLLIELILACDASSWKCSHKTGSTLFPLFVLVDCQ